MNVKFHFPGPVQGMPPRKIDPEIIDISDHNEIVSALVDSLSEILIYTGGADSALHDEYVVNRALKALAKARGEGNGN